MSPPPPPPPPRPSVLAAVLSKLFSILILLSLSLTVYAYRRTLEPLYGFAPTDHHFSKVTWAACILGSFLPTLPVLPATIATGILMCALPQSAYWVAVYTGRLGDPIWGPVATHAVTILPILYLGVALVKALQARSVEGSPESESAGQQLITLPVCQTSIMALQDLWGVYRPITDQHPSVFVLSLGALYIGIWAIAPYFPPLFLSPKLESAQSEVAAPEQATPVPPSPVAKSKNQRKKASAPKAAASLVLAPIPVPTPAPVASSAKKPSLFRLGVLPLIPALVTTVLQAPTLRQPLEAPYTHPSYPLRILASTHSAYSGAIVVGETAFASPNTTAALGDPLTLRYLRAGHSLLGGVWVGSMTHGSPLVVDAAGESLGESIYSAFVLQEAARLVVRPSAREHQKALIIGLGTGVSASSFMRHGLDTTLVELDAAVYEAAERYFGLPAPAEDRLVLKDARTWVRSRRRELMETAEAHGVHTADEELFDIVVHDVFSGGGTPGHLFTQQFWEDLKATMRPDGVVAVNHFEKLAADSSRAILLTLESVFGPCRAFSDTAELSEAHAPPADEPLNWVFFCSAAATDAPVFRPPGDADFLGSGLRRAVLSTLPLREADLAPIRVVPEKTAGQYILKDEANALTGWSKLEATHHWKMMREVLPDVIWETY